MYMAPWLRFMLVGMGKVIHTGKFKIRKGLMTVIILNLSISFRSIECSGAYMTCCNSPVIPVLYVSTVPLLMLEDQSICDKPDIQTIPRRCLCCGLFYLMM